MGTQTHFCNLLLQYGQFLFQSGKKPVCFPAALKIGDDFLRGKAHLLEFLNLQDAGNIVVVIVSVSAFYIGVGGSQQPPFFQTD